MAAEIELWLAALGQKQQVVVLPGLPVLDDDEDDTLMLQKQEKSVELLGVLGEIRDAMDGAVIVCDLEAATQPLPAALEGLTLKAGQTLDLQKLRSQLGHELGYAHEVVCEGPGQFAVRGGIIDVYPVNATAPVRLDFFGDRLESLREFDPATQRSEGTLKSLSISTARATGDWKSGNLAAYLGEAARWVLVEPAELEAQAPEHFHVPEKMKISAGHFANFVARRGDTWLGLSRVAQNSDFFHDAPQTTVLVETPSKYRPLPQAGLIGDERAQAERKILEGFVEKTRHLDAQTYAFSRGEMATDFQKILKPLRPAFLTGAISQGFILHPNPQSPTPQRSDLRQNPQAEGKSVIALAPADLPPFASVYTLSRRSRKTARRSAVNELLDFSQVAEGDYLVHLEHGICRYRGMGRLGDGEEVLSLEFDESVTLHLRFSEAHLISRYVGLSKKAPRLSRIGSQAWARAKKNAQQATLDFAAELLRLQAVRASQGGFAFAPDGELERSFDATFPYHLTSDQAEAIEATKSDMVAPKPMDRLVCGDVGFGKTEVALRAAVKAVASGKQVAILCPTTILSQQHFNTFNERAAGFGVVVEVLNRFRSAREQRTILKKLALGQIDVVVGTHRLLSRDVVFKDLGLIVIDEEHRFGVEQKEILKRLRLNADVLAMSATPIPRTLQMALGGARDLSIIETAPQNRRPIETIVKTFDEKTLREAIDYEISRGGQVFYLHNRVRTIAKVALRLQEMFPKARIAVGHGKMPEEELERVMTDFVAGHYDILVCTTIIESGLDIPNCNTLIIEGADQFGLSQLYQIRGRVGRFNRQAYAYLFLHKNKILEQDAQSRLEALRVHNELGAGFRIAMRDLELRGSGNLLGPQQSGHIAGVGFELYCELLKESVERLKTPASGKAYTPRTTVRLDFNFDTKIPADYLPEPRLRLELYRELTLAETLAEFEELSRSLSDRFGPPPQSVQNLLSINKIRIFAHQKGIISVATEGDRLMLMRSDGTYVKFGALFPRVGGGTPVSQVTSILLFMSKM